MDKKLMMTALLLGFVGYSLFVVKPAQAIWPFDQLSKASEDNQGSSSFPPLIQKLIDKFNLDPNEVGDVISEFRAEKRVQKKEQYKKKLNQAVADGKITEDQKAAILAKFDQMDKLHVDLDNLSPEQKRAKMKEIRDELKKWADKNGIDLSQVLPFRENHGHFHHHGMRI